MDFLVDRRDLHGTRIVAVEPPPPADGEALLAVERFAFTANNVTYAALGERLGYWRFFPADEPWGRIPVWGFARVERSRADGVAPGARFYGFLPMSSHVVVAPAEVGGAGFVDGAAHRRALPALYNRYLRASAEPTAGEAEEMVLRPQLATAFLIDDHLAENDFFGARATILSSASSKVALGLALLLARRGRPVWGLTSPRNAGFVERVGFYERVVPYPAVEALPRDVPAVYVDMAGDAALRRALHSRLPLAASILVGDTHWDAGPDADGLPGPAPVFFFAPDQIARRPKMDLRRRLDEAWQGFIVKARGWIRIVEARGPEAVERAYQDVLAGRAPPDLAYALSLA